MRIRWTEPAARDLTGICDYIKKHDGPAAASRVALEIYGGVGALRKFAHAVYRVRNDVVEIIRIVHGAQKWP